jgi:hypothetical protein
VTGVVVTLRLSPAMKAALERLADADGRSVPNYIVQVLRAHLFEREMTPLVDAVRGGAITQATFHEELLRRLGEEPAP